MFWRMNSLVRRVHPFKQNIHLRNVNRFGRMLMRNVNEFVLGCWWMNLKTVCVYCARWFSLALGITTTCAWKIQGAVVQLLFGMTYLV